MKRLFPPLCIAFPLVACGTQDSQETLPPPVPIAEWASRVDTLLGTYTTVAGPAEFHDSLLIVPDIKDRLVWRINLTRGTRAAFGSQGGGPGEYTMVSTAAVVHRDSVVIFQRFGPTPFPVIDVVTGRGRTHTPATDNSRSSTEALVLSVSEPWFKHADTLGALYGEPLLAPPERDSATGRMMPPRKRPDTAPVVRYVPSTGRVDTLLRYFTGRREEALTPDLIRQNVRLMGLGPYGPYNGWHVTREGDLVVVDAATYTVQLHRATHSEPREFSLAFAPIAVSDSGWSAYVERATQGGVAQFAKSMSDMSAQMGKTMGAPMPKYIVPEKPERLPPVFFGDGSFQMHSDKSIVWIPVHRTDPPRVGLWDLVDIDQGVRTTTLELPPNHRLLHVSSLGAYVAAKDEDDLERILLYRP